MSTPETITVSFGKTVFTTRDGEVVSSAERKLYKSKLALAKAQAKADDSQENALRVALYLKGKSKDVTLWQYIGSNPVVKLRRTSVTDPLDNDNPAEFQRTVSERALPVLPVWFDSIAKEYRTMRSVIASFFKLSPYIADETEQANGVVSTSKCFETMFAMAKLMGVSFNKAQFRAFETSANRLHMDEFGHASVKTADIDKLIMSAFHLSNAAIVDHDVKMAKKLK